MFVTKVEKQKKDETRYSIFINNKFAFGLSEENLLYYKITEGMELPEKEYNRIISETVYIKAKNTALRFLGYRARSRKELINKLTESEFGEDIIAKVLVEMERYGYIDDKKFALMFINDKTRLSGFGSGKISFALKEKGISEDIILECFEEIDFNEIEAAEKALYKKFKNGLADAKELNKAYGFLMRKGYPYDIIKEVIKRLKMDIEFE